MTSNVEKLNKWFEEQKAEGLSDVKFCPNELSDATSESFSGEVLEMISVSEQGHSTAVNFDEEDSYPKVSYPIHS